jgi:hypothetical protein
MQKPGDAAEQPTKSECPISAMRPRIFKRSSASICAGYDLVTLERNDGRERSAPIAFDADSGSNAAPIHTRRAELPQYAVMAIIHEPR